jgi:hypothetical protein
MADNAETEWTQVTKAKRTTASVKIQEPAEIQYIGGKAPARNTHFASIRKKKDSKKKSMKKTKERYLAIERGNWRDPAPVTTVAKTPPRLNSSTAVLTLPPGLSTPNPTGYSTLQAQPSDPPTPLQLRPRSVKELVAKPLPRTSRPAPPPKNVWAKSTFGETVQKSLQAEATQQQQQQQQQAAVLSPTTQASNTFSNLTSRSHASLALQTLKSTPPKQKQKPAQQTITEARAEQLLQATAPQQAFVNTSAVAIQTPVKKKVPSSGPVSGWGSDTSSSSDEEDQPADGWVAVSSKKKKQNRKKSQKKQAAAAAVVQKQQQQPQPVATAEIAAVPTSSGVDAAETTDTSAAVVEQQEAEKQKQEQAAREKKARAEQAAEAKALRRQKVAEERAAAQRRNTRKQKERAAAQKLKQAKKAEKAALKKAQAKAAAAKKASKAAVKRTAEAAKRQQAAEQAAAQRASQPVHVSRRAQQRLDEQAAQTQQLYALIAVSAVLAVVGYYLQPEMGVVDVFVVFTVCLGVLHVAKLVLRAVWDRQQAIGNKAT